MNPEPIGDVLKVISGNPSPEELAAVVAILEAAHAQQVTEGKKQVKKPASSWNRNTSIFRNDLTPGFGQWRAQYRPGLE
ncbi:MAG: acyl-CoA carboxylase subunit epsilon [Rhodoluna sp.]|jgi:hypothetical protein|nr:acyl-CoA carboxylase subunit epsilon [Rhodoluna sp.]